MVLLIQSIHQKAIDKNEEDEGNDAALVCKPEAEWKSGSGKCVGVQAVGEENSGAQANCRPDQKKDRHDADIVAPIPLELGGSGRRRWRFWAHVDGYGVAILSEGMSEVNATQRTIKALNSTIHTGRAVSRAEGASFSVLSRKYDYYLRWTLPDQTRAFDRSINVSVSPIGSALATSNLHRPYGFGPNGAVFGVAPPHNEEHCRVVAPPNPAPFGSEI